mmetsp:Transcript_22193/g.55499  ORF Transcript_22193/g.55499 Transcript_22193/m.55499 type:complete len:222 (-) Transcript_22193:1922-2587(-)
MELHAIEGGTAGVDSRRSNHLGLLDALSLQPIVLLFLPQDFPSPHVPPPVPLLPLLRTLVGVRLLADLFHLLGLLVHLLFLLLAFPLHHVSQDCRLQLLSDLGRITHANDLHAVLDETDRDVVHGDVTLGCRQERLIAHSLDPHCDDAHGGVRLARSWRPLHDGQALRHGGADGVLLRDRDARHRLHLRGGGGQPLSVDAVDVVVRELQHLFLALCIPTVL